MYNRRKCPHCDDIKSSLQVTIPVDTCKRTRKTSLVKIDKKIRSSENIPQLIISVHQITKAGCTKDCAYSQSFFAGDTSKDNHFTSFSTVFQSYQDDGRMMKGRVQWNPIYG